MWSINFNLRLLEAFDFVVDVVDFVILAVVVVDVDVEALLVATGHIIFSCGCYLKHRSSVDLRQHLLYRVI